MTVAELIAALRRFSPDTPVALATKRGEAEDFTVEESDGWVILEE